MHANYPNLETIRVWGTQNFYTLIERLPRSATFVYPNCELDACATMNQ
jgi:hypothetical protein